MAKTWMSAVTAHPSRWETTLPATLRSLESGGFYPRIAVNATHAALKITNPQADAIRLMRHSPAISAFGNWVLTAWELYLTNPHADYYAIFQDDIICSCNARQFLEATMRPGKAYYNLCCYPQNANPTDEEIVGARLFGTWPWYTARDGCGLGAQGLVIDNGGMHAMLGSPLLRNHPLNLEHGKCSIDGVVKTIMQYNGYRELVYTPSLIGHVNGPSTLGHPPQPETADFRGEDFDMMSLLVEKVA